MSGARTLSSPEAANDHTSPQFRKHGQGPYRVAVVHGGPGACGELSGVADELAKTRGVLEPLMTGATVNGQMEELGTILHNEAEEKVTLIGHSWGAMLSLLFAYRSPSVVGKLILVGCGPLDVKFASQVRKRRLALMGKEDRSYFLGLERADSKRTPSSPPIDLGTLEKIMEKTDLVDPLPGSGSEVDFHESVFTSVWSEAVEMRRSGVFKKAASYVACPVTVIHGENDPHPVKGVVAPLSDSGKNPRVILLPRCGHEPWREKFVREQFFAALRRELQ